jgi:hypothetical protein
LAFSSVFEVSNSLRLLGFQPLAENRDAERVTHPARLPAG